MQTHTHVHAISCWLMIRPEVTGFTRQSQSLPLRHSYCAVISCVSRCLGAEASVWKWKGSFSLKHLQSLSAVFFSGDSAFGEILRIIIKKTENHIHIRKRKLYWWAELSHFFQLFDGKVSHWKIKSIKKKKKKKLTELHLCFSWYKNIQWQPPRLKVAFKGAIKKRKI